MEFESYEEYKQHVYEMWSDGYINDLEDLIIVDKLTPNENGNQNINYRILTEQEYNKKYGK